MRSQPGGASAVPQATIFQIVSMYGVNRYQLAASVVSLCIKEHRGEAEWPKGEKAVWPTGGMAERRYGGSEQTPVRTKCTMLGCRPTDSPDAMLSSPDSDAARGRTKVLRPPSPRTNPPTLRLALPAGHRG